MQDYYNDYQMKFEYDETVNKFGFEKNVIGVQGAVAIVVTTGYTDASSIFVNSATGDDVNAGTQALPKATLLASCNACTSTKTEVIVLNSAHYAEELDTIDNAHFSGIYAAAGITATYSLRVLDYTPADANSIFVSADTGGPGAAGTQADPFDTITEAITACDATHQAIVIMDSATYTETAFTFTGNFLKLVAADGETPTVQPTINTDRYSSIATDISTTTFHPGDTTNVSSALLSTGSVVVAYKDTVDTYGKFIIYDSSGVVELAETTFNATDTSYIDVDVMSNDNIVIVFSDDGDGGKGHFVIYSSSGSVVKAVTQFSANTCLRNRVAIMSDNKFVIAYFDGTDGFGKFVVYTSAGVVSVAITTYTTNLVGALDVATMSDDKFVIVYQDSITTSGKFVIYTAAGAVSVAITQFHAANVANTRVAVMSDDKFVIVYEDVVALSGEFVIYTAAGAVSVAVTEFSASQVDSISVDILLDDSFVIAYRNTGDADKGKYSVWLKTGAVLVGATQFEAGNTIYVSVTATSTVTFIVFYVDVDDSRYGKFSSYLLEFQGIKVTAAATINGITFDANSLLGLKWLLSCTADLNISWCDLKNCDNTITAAWGLVSYNDVTMSNCKVYDNQAGVFVREDTSTFTDCLFYRNSVVQYALYIDGAAAVSGDISVTHCTFFENYSGILFFTNSGDEVCKNNIIHDNSVYGINATTAITQSYSTNTDVNLNVTDGNSVVNANPLFINEGAETPANIDLQLKLKVLGYPATSPAYLLADDTTPDRDSGGWNVSPIGSEATWTNFTVEKPAEGIDVKVRPIGKTQITRKDGSTASSNEAWEERVSIKFKGIRNAEFANMMLMLTCGNSTIRFYPDPTTNPTDYNTYVIMYGNADASPSDYRLSRTGIEGFKITFSRAYAP